MSNTTDKCRMCESTADYRFTLRNMGRYNIKYYLCRSCGCMQTEEPYWLEEAYRNSIRYTDTFVGDRSIRLPRLTFAVARTLGLSPRASVLDWGGGNGLMTRLMRDLGFDARNYDMYDTNTYAGGFDDEPGKTYDIVTSFEVLEHMANPKAELSLIFQRKPQIIFMSTCFFEGQDINWFYLAPYSGRHIFFHSTKALNDIAAKHGYSAIFENNLILLYRRKVPRWRERLARFVLTDRGQKFVAILLTLWPPLGRMGEDWQSMREKVGDLARDGVDTQSLPI